VGKAGRLIVGWRYGAGRLQDLLAAAEACDERALEDLHRLILPDITRVLAANLSDRRYLDEALEDVRVRIFVYLLHARFRLPDDATESTCRELLRRWATNTARNWARLVNKYGLITAQGRYALPQWAASGGPQPRRGIVPHQSIEGYFGPLDGEGSEDRMDRMAMRSLAHYGRTKVG